MSTSKTADAARKAVEKSQSKGKVERTPEEVIEQIRRNFAANLAVTPDDQKFLLAQYDTATGSAAGLQDAVEVFKEQIAVLTAKNEELRAVYEQENRSATLQVDVFEPSTPAHIGDVVEPLGLVIETGSAETGGKGQYGE